MSFIPLNAEDFVVSSDSITSTLWSGNKTTLSNVYIVGSGDEISSSFYLPVYSENPIENAAATAQFSIAYGNVYGSGSAPINPTVIGLSPTRITYGQYRTLINGDENVKINFGTGNTESNDLYVINISRTNYKEKLFPGTFNLTLSGSTAGPLKLTDNSIDSTTLKYCDAGRVFDIVSGSNGSATTSSPSLGVVAGYTVSGSYGKFLPDVGLIILNPQALKLSVAQGGIGLTPSNTNNNISLNSTNVNLKDAINKGKNFSLNSEETITSDYMFIRIKNGDFNYTTNPSMISGSGEFYFPSLVNNPQTYITTVGLYNDNNELLGVAKLSKPLVKDFTKEALIRVKLDF